MICIFHFENLLAASKPCRTCCPTPLLPPRLCNAINLFWEFLQFGYLTLLLVHYRLSNKNRTVCVSEFHDLLKAHGKYRLFVT